VARKRILSPERHLGSAGGFSSDLDSNRLPPFTRKPASG
jgi:hypothetical protein